MEARYAATHSDIVEIGISQNGVLNESLEIMKLETARRK